MYKEPKTMEWPYNAPFRGEVPASEHALNVAEYNMRDRPYGLANELTPYKKVYSYVGNRYTRPWIVDERQNPFNGTPYAWVRGRILGGKTLIWGRGALRPARRTSRPGPTTASARTGRSATRTSRPGTTRWTACWA